MNWKVKLDFIVCGANLALCLMAAFIGNGLYLAWFLFLAVLCYVIGNWTLRNNKETE